MLKGVLSIAIRCSPKSQKVQVEGDVCHVTIPAKLEFGSETVFGSARDPMDRPKRLGARFVDQPSHVDDMSNSCLSSSRDRRICTGVERHYLLP